MTAPVACGWAGAIMQKLLKRCGDGDGGCGGGSGCIGGGHVIS